MLLLQLIQLKRDSTSLTQWGLTSSRCCCGSLSTHDKKKHLDRSTEGTGRNDPSLTFRVKGVSFQSVFSSCLFHQILRSPASFEQLHQLETSKGTNPNLKPVRRAGRMPQDEMRMVFMSCCWTRGADLTRQRRWIIMEPVQEHVKCEWECDNVFDSSGVPCQGLWTDRDG